MLLRSDKNLKLLGEFTMKEIWELVDIYKEKIGVIHERGKEASIPEGMYHLVVEVWTKNSKNEILLTQRHPDKKEGLLWECTGGSVVAGEDSRDGAIRELFEETGLSVKKEELFYLGDTKKSNYIVDTYLYLTKEDYPVLQLQKEEVVDARWVNLDGMKDKQDKMTVGAWERYCQFEDQIKLTRRESRMDWFTKQMQSDMENYIEWESKFSFSNWRDVQIFVGNSLSEAWVKARPNEAYKFEDVEFKEMVNRANGKWLEKQHPDDTYKVILKVNNNYQQMLETYVHELRHCLDYQEAVKELPFEEYRVGMQFYQEWSEFRAVMNATRLCFWKQHYNMESLGETQMESDFKILSKILGEESADALHGIMNSGSDKKSIRYFISRYLGVQRAVRDINMEYGIHSPVFHVWNMTPTFITENFGSVFYIANEWEDRPCSLETKSETYYYKHLMEKIDEYCNKMK